MLVLTQTSLRTYLSCPFRYYLEYKRDLKTPDVPEALIFGREIHRRILQGEKPERFQEEVEGCAQAYQTLQKRSIPNYTFQFRFKEKEIALAVQVAEGVVFAGILDGLVKAKDTLMIYELKSTGYIRAEHWAKFERDFQITAYCYLIWKISGLNLPCLVDFVTRPKIKETKEESEAKIARIRSYLLTKLAFSRFIVRRTLEDLITFEETILSVSKAISLSLFPPNYDSCNEYRKYPCPFSDACLSREFSDLETKEFRHEEFGDVDFKELCEKSKTLFSNLEKEVRHE